MPQSDPLAILLAHDRWATAQLLDACRQLPADQFHQRFEIGLGSLHDTLTHIVGVVRALADTLAAAQPRPRLETDAQRRTPEQLLLLLDQASRKFSAQAARLPLSDTITRTTRDGKTLTLTRGAAFVHLATHNTHHRAQCLNMLRHLAVKPLPPVSVAEWTRLADTK